MSPTVSSDPRCAEQSSPFYGIYNWQLYLAQLGLISLLALFSTLIGWRGDWPVLLYLGVGFVALLILHVALLARESRRVLGGQAEILVNQVDDLIDLSQFPTILDAGCGLGRTLIGLLTRFPAASVTAIDIWDENQILGNSRSQLRFNLKSAGVLDRVKIEVGDIRRLPYELGRFDCALAVWVLHEMPVPDQKVALRQLANFVHAGGSVVVVEYLRCFRNFWVFGLINWHYYSYSHWCKCAVEAGLTIQQTSVEGGLACFSLRSS